MSTRAAIVVVFFLFQAGTAVAGQADETRTRIAVVSSYHPEYHWSQGTNEGLVAGLLEFGYLDTPEQAAAFTRNSAATSDRADIRKYWMDSKRKSSKPEIAATLVRLAAEIEAFAPDILLLGDDNAAHYVGNYFFDSELPIVFWGVNGTPVKYGLLDSLERPGHNVTGIYQKSYYDDSLELLLRLAPGARRLAILSDDSATGRAHTKLFLKAIKNRKQELVVAGVVATNAFATWQREALGLKDEVDAFLISTNYTLKDPQGNTVPAETVARWYLRNIRKPEVSAPINFVRLGMLATVFDSPYKQGYEAAKMAHRILAEGTRPANMPPYAPEHGGYILNTWRAAQLGLPGNVAETGDGFHELLQTHVALD